MAKPFSLKFSYTPNFLDNRKRVPDEQFSVTLIDTSIEAKVDALARFVAEAPDADDGDISKNALAVARMKAQKAQVEWRKAFAMPLIVSVTGLSVEDKDGKPVEVKTAEDLAKYAPDVVQDIASRLLFGAGEEELKNSPSPSPSASSATA